MSENTVVLLKFFIISALKLPPEEDIKDCWHTNSEK